MTVVPSIASQAAALTVSNSGWNGYTSRTVIAGILVTQPGTQIVVTLKGGTSGFSVDAIYVGHSPASPTHPWDFDGNQVQLKFGGLSTTACPAGFATIQSDPIPFNLIAGKALIIASHYNAGSDIADTGVGNSNYAFYWLSGNDAASTSTPGYSTVGASPGERLLLVSEVDVVTSGPLTTKIGTTIVIDRPQAFNLLGGTMPSLPAYVMPPLEAMTTYQDRQGPAHALIGGAVFCIGDSLFQGQPMQLFSPFAENYGMASDTIEGLLNRLPGYVTAMSAGRATILCIGVNNFDPSMSIDGASATQAQLQALMLLLLNWLSGPLVWIKIPHTNNATINTQIDIFNAAITAALGGRAQLAIVDLNVNNPNYPPFVDGSGLLLPINTIDGLHWSGSCFVNIVAPQVRAALVTV